jgi:hypothetical protein
MNNKKAPALLGALAMLLAAPVSAALYRCGNVFQDRPCEGGALQEVIQPTRSGGSMAPNSAAPARSASAPASSLAQDPPPVEAQPTALRKGPPSPACGNLGEQRTAIEVRLRAGGRAETMEMYQRQRREVEKNLAEANCP